MTPDIITVLIGYCPWESGNGFRHSQDTSYSMVPVGASQMSCKWT